MSRGESARTKGHTPAGGIRVCLLGAAPVCAWAGVRRRALAAVISLDLSEFGES